MTTTTLCFFCGRECTAFCDGCGHAICPDCDNECEVDGPHDPEAHRDDDEEGYEE